MDTTNISLSGWLKKGGIFLLFFLVESMVFAIIWGAVLFHAAGDCLIIFGAYASM